MNAREQFERDGSFVVPVLLTGNELAPFEPIVARAVHERSGRDLRPLDARFPYEQSFQQCTKLWEDYTEIRLTRVCVDLPRAFDRDLPAVALDFRAAER